MADHLVLGVTAAAAAAACFDGAVILQATEARQVDDRHTLRLSLLTGLARRPRWLAGAALAVLGWPLQIVAYAFAPVTVVQPTLALGLVFLLVVGARLLGERVGARQWAAAATIVAGVALLALDAPPHTDHDPSDAALTVTAVALALLALAPFAIQGLRRRAPALIIGAGSAFALSAVTSKLLTVALADDRFVVAAGWALVTAASSAVGLLIDTTAMQHFPATRVAPPMFVLETAIPVALAPVLFAESWGSTAGGGAVIVLGLLLVLAGGAVLGASHAGELHHGIRGGGEGAVAGVGDAR